MRIGLQTWGSEGDVQPFLALAAGLARAQHEVTLMVSDPTHRDYSEAARGLGIALIAVQGGEPPAPERFLELARDVLATGSPLAQMKKILDYWFAPWVPAIFEAATELCARSDVVVGHMVLHPLQVAAEKAGVPMATVTLAPGGTPSVETRPFGAPNIGSWANPWWWRFARSRVNRAWLPAVNALRVREGLLPQQDLLTESWSSPWLHLHAYSQVLCPRPGDWGDQHRVCGFFEPARAPSTAPIAPDLEDFLQSGEAPVYFTFGSLLPPALDALQETAEIWMSAVRRAGCRAIFQLPWDDLDVFGHDPRVFKLQRSRHSAVFPRCAMVVHHGGAGTTQTSLLAGRPAVVVPHIADQFFWGAALEKLGVAGRSQPRAQLSPAGLAGALAQVLHTPSMAERALRLGGAMAAEQGVALAVGAIEARMKIPR